MSVLYTISSIIIAVSIVNFLFNVINVIEGKTSTLSLNNFILGLIILGLMYGARVEHRNGYNVGYQQAIEDAQLATWDYHGYDITFNGELHSYEWGSDIIYFNGERINP